MRTDSFIPIYKRLTDYYRTRILTQDLLPGQRIDSINRIMERHSVSRETAKLVQERLRQERLIVSIAGKGSFITPQSPMKKAWGLLFPSYTSNIENLISHLEEEAGSRGRKLIHFLTYNDAAEEEKLAGSMIREGYEAVIVIPNSNESLTAGFYRSLITGRSELVLIDHTMAGSWFKYVIQSYDLGIRRAVEYLVSKQNKNLLLVQNDLWRGRNLLNELIRESFFSHVKENHPHREIHVLTNTRELSEAYIREKSIGGILSTSDIDSVKVLGRLKNWGFDIPGEVSLISYGNTELTEFFEPAISVIDSNYREMARYTGRLILGEETDIIEQYVIQPELLVRET